MELHEARALLGVDPRSDARAIKRAYLRAVKKHRPERDPEGFQRVRAAFEVARLWAAAPTDKAADEPQGDAAPSPTPEAATPADPPESAEPEAFTPDPERDAARRAREQALAERLDQMDPADRVPAIRAAFEEDTGDANMRAWLFEELIWEGALDEATALLEGAHESERVWMQQELEVAKDPPPDVVLRRELEHAPIAERIAALQEAMAEDPTVHGVRSWLFHELLDDGQIDAAAEVARGAEGVARAHMLAELAQRDMGAVADDEVDFVRDHTPQRAVPLLLSRGRVDDAASLVKAQLETLEQGESHFFAGGIIGHIVQLARGDEGDLAESLYRELQRVVVQQGLGTRLGQQDALDLLLLGELFEVWDELPSPVWGALMDGLGEGNWEQTRASVRGWSRVHRGEARRTRGLLQARAPSLSSLVDDVLQTTSSGPSQYAPKNGSPWWLVPIAMFAVTGFFRITRGCDSSTPDLSQIRAARPTPAAPVHVSESMSEACHRAPQRCSSLLMLEDAVDAETCFGAVRHAASARAALERIQREDGPSTSVAADQIRSLLERAARTCPSQVPP